MKHTKIVLLTAAVVMMTQALGLSVAAEEETSAQSGEESVIDADSLSSDESSKETLTSGDYSYTLDGDNATITKYNGSETAVTIPDKLDGHTVTTLGSGTFATKDMITSITIPATVDTINSSCFYGCTVLEQVSLAEGKRRRSDRLSAGNGGHVLYHSGHCQRDLDLCFFQHQAD